MNTEKSSTEAKEITFHPPVIKSFIAICGNEYFEGEKLFTGQIMGVMGFERDEALLMTEDEVKDICSRYRECKAINIL